MPRNERISEMAHGELACGRVIVASATRSCGGAVVAELLDAALGMVVPDQGVVIAAAGPLLEDVRRSCAADVMRFVVVTRVASAALAAAYALVKAIETERPGATIEILVIAPDETRAHAAFARVRAAAGRFLERDVAFAGAFPEEELTASTRLGTREANGTTRAERVMRIWAARLHEEITEGAGPTITHSRN